jgi:hypothetical protein
MKLIHKDKAFTIDELNPTDTISIKSGQTLKHIEGSVSIEKGFNPEELSSPSTVEIMNETNGERKKYNLYIKQTSYSDSLSYWKISFYCDEIEDYTVNEININDVCITPYKYSEEIDKEALIITLKAEVNKTELEKIKETLRTQKTTNGVSYFRVKRKGLTDKQMRFGQPIWSEYGENVKIKLILVEQAYDKETSNFAGFNEPDLSNMKTMVADLKVSYNNLIKLLLKRKSISDPEYYDLVNITDIQEFNELFSMKKVDDVDIYED